MSLNQAAGSYSPRASTQVNALYGVDGPGLSRSGTTTTTVSSNTDFFSAFIIDSPSVIVPDSALLRQLDDQVEGSTTSPPPSPFPHAQGDVEDRPDDRLNHVGKQPGGTPPLRVRKKKSKAIVRVAPIGPTRRRRGSTLSLPRSPRSPHSPRFHNLSGSRPSRNPSSGSTNSSRDPHSTISHLFLSMPAVSPSPTTGFSYNLPRSRHTGLLPAATIIAGSSQQTPPGDSFPQRELNVTVEEPSPPKRSSDSSLHLGLGRFGSYDPIVPGPSPPFTPGPSPTKASGLARAQNSFDSPFNDTGYVKPLPQRPVPSSPLTPSRAPRKAAALLGAGHTTSSDKRYNAQAGTKGMASKSRLRSKPGANFLPLPNAALKEIERFFGDVPLESSKPSARSSKSRATRSSLDGEGPDPTHRNLGQGNTAPYKAEDGSMWLDIEEEQEFAWLMGEVFAAVPAPLPKLQPSSELHSEGKVRERGVEVTVMLEQDDSEGDDLWGMERFTSVLSLPKPKSGKKDKSANSRRAKGSDESFFDFADPGHRQRGKRPANVPHPWARVHTRSHSNPLPSPSSAGEHTATSAAFSPSFQRLSSANTNVRGRSESPLIKFDPEGSVTDPGSRSGSETGSSTSPSRRRQRPPPLTLPRSIPNGILPILTPSSPAPTNGRGVRTKGGQGGVTMIKTLSEPGKMVEVPDTPFVRPRAAPRPKGSHLPTFHEASAYPVPPPIPKQEEVSGVTSFFEPVTPVEPTFGGRGKGWFKRVVKPLGGGVMRV